MLAASVAALGPCSISDAQTPANLPQVRASLESRGARATVQTLESGHQWDAVLDGIGKGEAAWIALAPRLAVGTDAGSSEGLGIALAEALPKAPAAVLSVLDPKDGPVIGVSRVCGAPFVEPKPGFLASYKSQAATAVTGVRAPGLRAARDACLAALRKS